MKLQHLVQFTLIAAMTTVFLGCNQKKIDRSGYKPPLTAPGPDTIPAPQGDMFSTDESPADSNLPENSTGAFRLPPPQLETDSVNNEESETLPSEPNDEGSQPEDTAWNYRTGRFFSDDLYYVGAGPDQLVPALRNKMQSVAQIYQDRNQALADRILVGRMNSSKGDFEINLAIEAEESDREGRPQYDNLTLVTSSGVLASGPVVVQGSNPFGRPVDGRFECMDSSFSGSECETGYLRLVVGEPGQQSIANIIFRETRSNIYTEFTNEDRGRQSRSYSELRNYLIQAQSGKNVTDRFRFIYYSSFAVIMGRSGFHVKMDTADQKMVEFKGALLASKSGGTKVSLSRPQSYPNELDYDLAQTIGKAFLLSANGQGDLKVQVLTQPEQQGQEEEMIFNFQRKVSPTRSLE